MKITRIGKREDIVEKRKGSKQVERREMGEDRGDRRG